MRHTVFAALLLVFPSFLDMPAAVSSAALQATSDTVVGTIRALDLKKGEVRVVTGVALSLRVVSFRATTDTRASAAGAALALGELRAGDVVRVIGGRRPEGRIAYAIERLAAAERAP